MTNQERADKWLAVFYNFIRNYKGDILKFYAGRIAFSPAIDNPNILYARYSPPDHLTKEQKQQMFMVFDNYVRENPV